MKTRHSVSRYKLTLFLWSVGSFVSPALWADSPTNWVSTGPDHRLLYAADALGNQIPDFSNCGYEGGGVPIPVVPVKVTLDPARGDAGERIQAAIAQVSNLPLDPNGFRGAVLLHKGTYPITGVIKINVSGVVLRGEGQGGDDTRLIATGAIQRTLITVGGSGGPASRNEDDEKNDSSKMNAPKASIPIIDSYVPVGAHFFHVADASSIQVGESVVVFRPSPENWIHELGMDSIPQNKSGTVKQWTAGSKNLTFRRRVTAISGNLVTVEAPICCALDQKYGGGVLQTGLETPMVRHSGVENLSADSEYKSADDESHGWTLVSLNGAKDCWVRDVTSIHFGYSCVQVERSSIAITVQDCSCLDAISKIMGGRRYPFNLGGQLSLVLRCSAREGRHDFVMGSCAPGPNAFVDCKAESSHAESGPHHRWSVGTLYDNLVLRGEKGGGELNIHNRGSLGTGQGWAGANQVIWNSEAEAMNVQQPPTAQNWCIGSSAESMSGDGYFESKGTKVFPDSLYKEQLSERVGNEAAQRALAKVDSY